MVIALAACAPTATPVPTPAAPATATVAAPTKTAIPATVAPTNKTFAFNGVQVVIPAAIASGASGQIVPAAQGADLPEFATHPAYTEIRLTGYPVQNDQFEGMIQVLPVAEYKKLSQAAGQRAQAMQTLLAQKPAAPTEEIPVLPVYNAAQVIRAQVQYLNMQNGAGVRFLAFYAQGLMPVTNKELFYTYQGLTADGAHWVSAILPVNAAFLAADAKSAGNPPAGGIPFPANADGAQVKAYYQAMTDKLSATPAGGLTPALAALDAMMQSLRITAP
jgi:hypothetical protein